MGPNLQFLSIALFLVGMALSLSFAIWKGAEPERIGAGVLLAGFLLQIIAYAVFPPRYFDVDAIALLADLIFLAGFGWLAINARRVWPIWAAAFQLLSIMSHFARFVEMDIEPYVYSVMKSLPTGLAIVLLSVGTIMHRRRLARRGSDPSWMAWSRMAGRRSGNWTSRR